jgi:hypothetical protein
MSNTLKKIIITTTVVILVILSVQTANAVEYIPISGSEVSTELGIGDEIPDLKTFINKIFQIGIRIAGVLAVLIVIFGGIQYMTTDAFQSKSEGKERIKRAMLGLGIALSSILILNTINPRITDFTFELDGVEVKGDAFQIANLKLDAIGNIIGIDTDGDGVVDSGVVGTATQSKGTPDLKRVGDTLVITPVTKNGIYGVRLDTDGIEPPPFYDSTRQSQTSVPGLNANKDYFVVVPKNSLIPNKTVVTVTNNTNNTEITAIVGDRGPNKNGYGEMSLAAARSLGVWKDGDGDAINNQDDITYTFHLKDE